MKTYRRALGIGGLGGMLLAASMSVVAPTAVADPGESERVEAASDTRGRGSVPEKAATQQSTRLAEQALSAETETDALDMPASYPYQPQLRVYPDNTPDAADSGSLIGHDDIAPELMDLMRTSNRVSAQVVGQSTQGRDLYLVTVTAPETSAETAQQTAWRREIKSDPVSAAADTALTAGYKTPIWISANIHGNEWEGTDAAMAYVEELATAPWSEVSSLLRKNRLYFSVVLNPDGRTIGQRATALNLDPNRDMITNTTPETVSFIKTAQAIQPMYSADFHGYTNVLQVEPCGPPHGENYEFDLFLPQAYAMALAVEEDVVDAAIPGNTYFNVTSKTVVAENTSEDTAHIKIPYRDTASGWDDYPPIFTAQYAAFFGASTSTVELPKARPNLSTQSPANAVVNKAVALQTMKSMTTYFSANRGDFLHNQVEAFRRGVAGEPKTSLTSATIADVPGPDQWKSLWDAADDQDAVTLPRAYVIPVGDGQRSASDASRLVEQLLLHKIQVSRLTAGTTVAGKTYPAGSYVVDLHQPMRGLANSLLDLGSDISAKVPSMYDISAWSYSYLWGATVDKVGLTTDAPIGATTRVTTAPSNASVPAKAGYTTFDVAGVDDVAALNALLSEDVAVSMLADGSAVVGPQGYAQVTTVADEYGIAFSAATAADIAGLEDPSTKGLEDLTIGYSGSQDDTLSLAELGFDDLVPVTATTLAANPALLDSVDVLWVGSTLATTNATVLSALQAYVASGRSVVGRGTAAFNLEKTLGLVSGTAVNGWSSGNGIVDVDTPEGSVLAPYAQDYSFIYPAYTFTDLGEGTKVEQSYGGTTSTLLAGHWRSTTTTNGPDYFAGKPSVISGSTTSGAKGLVFGTSVLFRTHPKGGLSQAARAILWAGPSSTGVPSPSSTTLTVDVTSPITYPGAATVEVLATAADDAVPTGTVEVRRTNGAVVARGTLAAGVAKVKVPGLRPGATGLTVAYVPADGSFEPAQVTGVRVVVAKASSATRLTLDRVAKRKVRLTVRLSLTGLPSNGVVVITDRGRTIARVAVRGGAKTVTLKLRPGKHKLRATYRGTGLTKASASPVRSFTSRR